MMETLNYFLRYISTRKHWKIASSSSTSITKKNNFGQKALVYLAEIVLLSEFTFSPKI